jgi:5-methylcytosine-specific restriction endonuclease McrA
MANILNKHVLLLNKAWVPIGTVTVKKAFEDMNSSKHPKKALKIEYACDDNGEFDFSAPTEILPLAWNEWATISPREFDEDSIRTINLELRIPTVIIVGSNYNLMPVKTFRPTKKNIYDHYGGRCVWTGKVIPYKKATIEHMHPRSRGGKNTWGNLAIADPEPNREKADRTPEEYGVKPKYKLSEPKPVPAHVLIKSVISPDWNIFLKFG